jgi:hypothetical protein
MTTSKMQARGDGNCSQATDRGMTLAMGCEVRRNRNGSSIPTTSASMNLDVWSHAKPQYFGDSRDSKNDSIWAARREMQRDRSNLSQTLFLQFDRFAATARKNFRFANHYQKRTYEKPGIS